MECEKQFFRDKRGPIRNNLHMLYSYRYSLHVCDVDDVPIHKKHYPKKCKDQFKYSTYTFSIKIVSATSTLHIPMCHGDLPMSFYVKITIHRIRLSFVRNPQPGLEVNGT